MVCDVNLQTRNPFLHVKSFTLHSLELVPQCSRRHIDLLQSVAPSFTTFYLSLKSRIRLLTNTSIYCCCCDNCIFQDIHEKAKILLGENISADCGRRRRFKIGDEGCCKYSIQHLNVEHQCGCLQKRIGINALQKKRLLKNDQQQQSKHCIYFLLCQAELNSDYKMDIQCSRGR